MPSRKQTASFVHNTPYKILSYSRSFGLHKRVYDTKLIFVNCDENGIHCTKNLQGINSKNRCDSWEPASKLVLCENTIKWIKIKGRFHFKKFIRQNSHLGQYNEINTKMLVWEKQNIRLFTWNLKHLNSVFYEKIKFVKNILPCFIFIVKGYRITLSNMYTFDILLEQLFTVFQYIIFSNISMRYCYRDYVRGDLVMKYFYHNNELIR